MRNSKIFRIGLIGMGSLLILGLLSQGCGNLEDLGDPEMARARHLCSAIFEPGEFESYVYAVELDFARGYSASQQAVEASAVCNTYPSSLADDCGACALAVIEMVADRQAQ
jgi:hypothetical protein